MNNKKNKEKIKKLDLLKKQTINSLLSKEIKMHRLKKRLKKLNKNTHKNQKIKNICNK